MRVFCQAPRPIEQRDYARVNNPVEDLKPIAARCDNATISQSLELVRNGLRFHADRSREVIDAQLIGPNERVQKPQPRIVRQHFEHGGKITGLARREDRSISQVQLRPTAIPCSRLFSWSPRYHAITLVDVIVAVKASPDAARSADIARPHNSG